MLTFVLAEEWDPKGQAIVFYILGLYKPRIKSVSDVPIPRGKIYYSLDLSIL